MPAGLKYPFNGILLASWHTKPAIINQQIYTKTQNNKITANYWEKQGLFCKPLIKQWNSYHLYVYNARKFPYV